MSYRIKYVLVQNVLLGSVIRYSAVKIHIFRLPSKDYLDLKLKPLHTVNTFQGFLAKVSCQEVWCPMTAEFYREYLRVGSFMTPNELEHSFRMRRLNHCLLFKDFAV